MLSRKCMGALGALLLAGCTAQSNEFVPGQPLRFPLNAKPALAHMGKQLEVNCKADDKAVEAKCRQMLSQRAAFCLPDVGVVDQAAYRGHAKTYLTCVMPRPICRGVEMSSDNAASGCPR